MHDDRNTGTYPSDIWGAEMKRASHYMRDYAFDGDVAADLRDRLGYDGPLLDIYAHQLGELVHKWHHYLPIYDRYFADWRGKPLKFLEIGVYKGGSLEMWRRYFGNAATIFGIDIDPACAAYDGRSGQVRIGSQADPDFLARVVEEMGGVDIVLDDGSHKMHHIRKSLDALFPKLSDDGLYMIEDLQTAYWLKFGGGRFARRNFFNHVRALIDDMHHWYHAGKRRAPGIGDQIGAMHIHNAIVVLEKGANPRPVHSQVKGH